ncbi:MAG: hypothetical protein K0U98_00030 [Deltaproteobacteria bacterium]|nr:hypothetical protein [Deltaproteobacteria bacterium]
MTPMVRSLAGLVLAASLGACASTQFLSTWQNPDVVFGRLHGEKVAAFLISDDEDARRSAEEVLASELTARGAEGIAGHTLLTAEDGKDKAVAQAKLEKAGVQAVVTMRVVNEAQTISSTPATWHQSSDYGDFGRSWTRGWGSVYDPGHARPTTVVQVETMIYSLESNGLIWAGLSETTDPKGADALVKELSEAVDDAIKKSGLLR